MSVMSKAAPRRITGKAKALVTSKAGGAGIAQIWQAAGSFAIQIAAAHALGAKGLGLMSLCLGVIIITTAVASGLVGDSLTVLDRHDARVRAGLQVWLGVVMVIGSAVAATVLAGLGLLTVPQAAAFFLAAAFFQLEEIIRRIFMARMAFWRLVVIDTSALVVTLAVTVGSSLAAVQGMGSFLAAIALGQIAGCVAGLVMLPAQERRLVSLRGAAIREVVDFGGWRGLQVAVGPSGLTMCRLVVVATVGSAALGEVEAARIFSAPAMLAVQGFGSYLLSSYARDKTLPVLVLRARAVKASLLMATMALVLGGIITLCLPWVGFLVTGGTFAISPVAVMGWAILAAATASLQPFASLAVARGRQRAVFGIRVVDVVAGLGILGITLTISPNATVTPYAIAAGVLIGGILVRRLPLNESAIPTTGTRTTARPVVAPPAPAS